MKKVGIVTIIDYYNFGNRLQNYAVSHLLNDRFGCKAITLEGYQNRLVEGNTLRWLKEQLALQLCRFPGIAEKKLSSRMIRWFNFSEWSRQWIPRKRFYSCNILPKELNSQFDLFVSGSDQVWNYRIKNLRLEDFFLSFTEDRKKNSISASFGVDQIPEEQKPYYIDNLSRFAHISVREEIGAEIVKNLIGRDVPVLIDPVMMLSPDEWMHVEKKPRVDISRPYILKYFLGDEGKGLDEWAAEKGYVIYDLMNKNKKELYTSGPGEFLSLVRNASLICSDSFHCIAFAILFSRSFIVYERQGTENYMASRLNTLLDKFGFQDRWSKTLTSDEYLSCDFRAVNELLEFEKKKFADYMMEVLQDQ